MFSLSTRNGGDEMDPSIVNSVKKEYNLVIDDRTAKELKIRIGCAEQIEGEIGLTIEGHDAIIVLPKKIIVSSTELGETLNN